MESCEEFEQLLEGGRWAGDFDIVTDWSFICRQFHGPGYLLVGDAACFVDPILASGIALALQGVLRATKAIRTSLEAPGPEWAGDELVPGRVICKQANDFVDMANHWYHGQRLQESWYWTAHRLVDPSQNLSLRQAFVFISSGLTRESPEESIRYMGGFTPGQLAVTYEALGAEAHSALPRPAETPALPSAPRGVAVTAEQALAGRPAFVAGAEVRAWMQETERGLRPVTQIELPGATNGDRREILLSLPTLSVLNLLDGRRSGAQVAQTLAERFAGSVRTDAAALRPIVGSVIADLAAEGAVDLG